MSLPWYKRLRRRFCPADYYRCGVCGEDYRQEWSEDWSQADVEAECQARFGYIPPSERRIVCHDCFQTLDISQLQREYREHIDRVCATLLDSETSP